MTKVTKTETREVLHADWVAEGTELFGADLLDWRFVCPACGHVAAGRDWKEAGANAGAVGFSCVGRWALDEPRGAFKKGPGPCDYAGGGLFGLNPVTVKTTDGETHEVFEFAREVPDGE